jgi:hypothetical protein
MTVFERGNIRAPELFGDYWLNSEPTTMRELRGSVVLIEFWDYSSTGSVRSLPYLREWSLRYSDFDLRIVGVHTPQFKFGRNPEHVEAALRKLNVEFPVVMDNDGVIWTAYSSRMWPTMYLVDRDGFLRFAHQGEGGYQQFERWIQTLLAEAGYHGEFPELLAPIHEADIPGAMCHRATPDAQLGYLRGTIGNPEGYGPESTIEYNDRGFHLPGRVYLDGKWYNERESVRFDGEQGESGRVTVMYEALEVDSVMSVEGTGATKVFATQDKHSLTKENAGLDVLFEEDGKSYVLVDAPRRFNIVVNKEFGMHELELSLRSPGVEVFTVSFVTGVIPELVSAN